VNKGGAMKKLLFPLIFLSFFSCSKQTVNEPIDRFTLYVDNQTTEAYEIYVTYYGNEEFAGMAESYKLSELGKFRQDEFTVLSAKQNEIEKFNKCVDTRGESYYTWYIKEIGRE